MNAPVILILISLLLSAVLYGCSSSHTPLHITQPTDFDEQDEQGRCRNDSIPGVTLTKLTEKDNIATLRLANNRQCTLSYFHWLTQGPEPVVYCQSKDERQWNCSLEVFVLEEQNGQTFFLTHDIYLRAEQTVDFKARTTGASAIGVRFWSRQAGSDVFVWYPTGK